MNNTQKQKLLEKTKEALKLAIQSSIKHSKNTLIGLTHTTELIKIHKEDRSLIQRLNNVIDMKQREIDDVKGENLNILWKMAQLEKKVTELELYRKEAAEVAEWEKKLTEDVGDKSVDN